MAEFEIYGRSREQFDSNAQPREDEEIVWVWNLDMRKETADCIYVPQELNDPRTYPLSGQFDVDWMKGFNDFLEYPFEESQLFPSCQGHWYVG